MVARALGAPGSADDQQYEMSVCNVDLTPVGEKIFGKKKLVRTPIVTH